MKKGGNPPGKISVEDLPPEVLEKMGLKLSDNSKEPKMVKPSVIAIGGVLQALKGLTNREALWALRTSTVLVRGYRKDKEPGLGKERTARSNKGWKRKETVDERQ